MTTRRKFLKCLTLVPFVATKLAAWAGKKSSQWVNDIHSKLNRTRVARILQPDHSTNLAKIIKDANQQGANISICGGRHAMGAQQFASDTRLLDTTKLSRVLSLDKERGIVEVEPGIQWPELIEALLERQQDDPLAWTIAQKQTGADRLTVGGALAANIHSRGLSMQPIISNIVSFEIILASGEIKNCSRTENTELFNLAIGGYGLFGLIKSVQLQLVHRKKLKRQVSILQIDEVMPAFEAAISQGALYGDFQFSIDPQSEHFLQEGVFSTYHPVHVETPIEQNKERLDPATWDQLLLLAHTDKAKAFALYTDFYLKTDGQHYWSDEHQMNDYSDDYHQQIDEHLHADHKGSEMITEIYVPRDRLVDFMKDAAKYFQSEEVDVIYGTIRLIKQDNESFLAWAKQPYACIIFNLHVVHTEAGIAKASEAFRRLIDMAIARDGSYYLTYHKWATKEQLVACYPQFAEFLQKKLSYDPNEVFISDWYRHYRTLFSYTNSNNI